MSQGSHGRGQSGGLALPCGRSERLPRPPGSGRRASRRLDDSRAPGDGRGRAGDARASSGAWIPARACSASSRRGTDLEAAARLMAGRRLRAALRAGRGSRERATRWSAMGSTSGSRRAGARSRSRSPTACRASGLGTILLAHLAEVAAGQRDPGLRRRGPAGEPPDDRGLPRERLPGRDVVEARHDPRRAADLALATRRWSVSRIATGSRRRPRSAASSSPGRSP